MNKTLKLAMRLLLGAVLLTSSSQALAEKLNLSKGTMMLGGAGNAHLKAKGMDVGNGTWEHRGNIEFGYFVIDRLAVLASLGGGGPFSITAPFTKAEAGVGVSYAFDINSIVSPYLGTKGIFGFMPAMTYGLEVNTGILIALNQHVAVDLGLKVGYNFTNKELSGALGFVGVRGFF